MVETQPKIFLSFRTFVHGLTKIHWRSLYRENNLLAQYVNVIQRHHASIYIELWMKYVVREQLSINTMWRHTKAKKMRMEIQSGLCSLNLWLESQSQRMNSRNFSPIKSKSFFSEQL